MTAAALAVFVAVVAFIGSIALLAYVWRHARIRSGGRCAECGGNVDRATLACGACDADVRIVGLTPARATVLPGPVGPLMLAALVPLAVTIAVAVLHRPERGGSFILERPLVAEARDPASGAHGGVRIMMRRELTRTGVADAPGAAPLPAFATIRLFDRGGDHVAMMIAVRCDGSWWAGACDGPALDAEHLAGWLVGAAPAGRSYAAGAALAEAHDILTLFDGLEHPRPFDTARTSQAMQETLSALRDEGSSREEIRAITEQRIRQLRSGVELEAFEDWKLPSGRGFSGGGRPVRNAVALRAGAASWLAVTGALLLVHIRRRNAKEVPA